MSIIKLILYAILIGGVILWMVQKLFGTILPREEVRCNECRREGRYAIKMKGSDLLEILLWLTFLFPGYIYGQWRLSTKHRVCRYCSSPYIVSIARGSSSTGEGGNVWKATQPDLSDSCKTGKSIKKPFPIWPTILAVLVGGLVALPIWMLFDNHYPIWSEEVRLSDGRIINIYQMREFHENYGTAASWVLINLPEVGGWRIWSSNLRPQRIDVVNGRFYAFGSPRGDRQYSLYDAPINYMVGFTWDGEGFQRIPFLNVPEQIRAEENVIPCISREFKGELTVSAKDKKWCPPRGSKKQFTKRIDLIEYQKLSSEFGRINRVTKFSD
jgi:hypothetical protein